jgi:hypothetical protein
MAALGRNDAAELPQPISVRDAREWRASTSATGSGSVAARTAELREAARQQQEQTLGFDPTVARHAWQNTNLRALRAKGVPQVTQFDEDAAAEHSGKCPLCEYLVSPMSGADLDATVPNYENVATGMSALLGICCEARLAREAAISRLCEYYERKVAAPSRAANGGTGEAKPLTRSIVREHLRFLTLPSMSRRATVRRLEDAEELLCETTVSYNTVTGQVRPDYKNMAALAKIASVKEQILRSLEGRTGERIPGAPAALACRPDLGCGPTARSAYPPAPGAARSAVAQQFTGYR